jgi:biopolymer transport protein ExbD
VVTLAIDAKGKLYWNDELLAETELPARLEEAAGRTQQPELQPTRVQERDLPAHGRGDVRGAARWYHET